VSAEPHHGVDAPGGQREPGRAGEDQGGDLGRLDELEMVCTTAPMMMTMTARAASSPPPWPSQPGQWSPEHGRRAS